MGLTAKEEFEEIIEPSTGKETFTNGKDQSAHNGCSGKGFPQL